MYLCRVMLLGDMICEANEQWPRLSAKHCIIKGYSGCQDFFDTVSKEQREVRDALFRKIVDSCNGSFDCGDIILLVVLCYPELRSILGWKTTSKMDDEEKLQIWLSMVCTFIEAINDPVNPKGTIVEIRRVVNKMAERNRRQASSEKMRNSMLGSELSEIFEAPALVMPTPEDYREVWEIIQRAVPSPRELSWVKGLIAEMTALPGFEISGEIPKLPSDITGRIRDMIARAIMENSPRLSAFVRLKKSDKRRRTCGKQKKILAKRSQSK